MIIKFKYYNIYILLIKYVVTKATYKGDKQNDKRNERNKRKP